MAVTTPPPERVDIDDGVIEEARRRQRRRRVGRAGLLVAAGAVAAALLLGSGGSGRASIGSTPLRPQPQRLTFVRGVPYVDGQIFPLAVRPYLGGVGVSLDMETLGGGTGGASYPGRGMPLFGDDGWQPGPVGSSGELDYVLAKPDVAAVRVPGVGLVKPVGLPELPPRIRAVVFYRPPGARGTIVPPGMTAASLNLGSSSLPGLTLTPLDASGRPISTRPVPSPFTLPNIYWQRSATVPAGARCAIRSATRARVQRGIAASAITPDSAAVGPAFLNCLRVWYTVPGGAIQAAVLLNAQHPGAPPALLWGSYPLAGHPGLVEIPPIRYKTRRVALGPQVIARLAKRYGKTVAQRMIDQLRTAQVQVLGPRVLARRVGDAWLLVQNGTLEQQLTFLKTLSITRLDLSQSG